MERVPIKSDPKLFDAAVAKIQILLADAFPWLDHSFGICEKLTDTKDGKKFNSANMYIGKGSYAQIMPCSELGNFSFFILRDPQERSKKDKNLIKAPFSLIIWYDTRNVSLATDERNREAIKEQILNLLNPHAFAWLNITKTYESPDKIFSDFSYDYTNNQFLMSPYAGLRLDGEMLVRLSCGNTPIIPDRGYSKSEIDAMMLRKADKDEVGDLNDLETEDKSSIVAAINELAEGGSVDAYTKEESDNKFAPKSNTYTKTEVDGKLAGKANDDDVVHKTGVENITGKKYFSSIDAEHLEAGHISVDFAELSDLDGNTLSGELRKKADASKLGQLEERIDQDFYTKAQIDAMIVTTLNTAI